MSTFPKIFRVLAIFTMVGGMAIAQAANITAAIGTDQGSGYAFTFVGASDGNVWLSTNYGGTWHWQNLAPLNVSFGVGVTSPGGYPAAYAVGTDGNLYIIHQIGSSWSTFNIGTPTGVALRTPIGVITNNVNQPFVYLIGSDGNIWLAHNTGSWLPWQNLGTPPSVGITSPVGAVMVPGSYPQIFVIGTDGNMWVAQWNGSYYPWTKLAPSSYPVEGLGALQEADLPWGVALESAPWDVLVYYQASSGGPWAPIYIPLGSPSQPPLAFTVGAPASGLPVSFVTNGGSVLVRLYEPPRKSCCTAEYTDLTGTSYVAKASAGVTVLSGSAYVFLVNTSGDLEVIYGNNGNLGNAEAIDLGTPP